MRKTTPATRSHITLTAVIIFLLLAVLYFLPIDIPFKTAFPLTALTILSVWVLPWQMCLAMLFSTAGDVAGDLGLLIPQIGFFSMTQIMLAVYFLHRAVREGLYSSSGYSPWKSNGRFIFLSSVTVFSLLLTAAAVTAIVPNVYGDLEPWTVAAYSALTVLMFWSAIIQRDLLFAAGAALFVASDFILGWDRFISPVSGADYLIMIPYYMAQIILFVRSTIPVITYNR